MDDYEPENELLKSVLSAAHVSDRESALQALREGRCAFNVGDPAPLEALAKEFHGGMRLIAIRRAPGAQPVYLLIKREGQNI